MSALRDLFPASGVKPLAGLLGPAGVDLGEIVAASGGALENVDRAELRNRLLDPSDPASAALVVTQWKLPDDEGFHGHIELVVNQREEGVAKQDGRVLSVEESTMRDYSADVARDALAYLAILFDETGNPLRPLSVLDRERYPTQLRIPFGRIPGQDADESTPSARADTGTSADALATEIVRLRGIKKLTGVDLGIVTTHDQREQESGSTHAAQSDPAPSLALAQRPHPSVIVLSGDLVTVTERARAIRDYVDDRWRPP
ncbi:hypothetical protein [Nocardia brasiliensis]|uniref:hypothetical protein n=1 Tax=Nocardia brasiliensis TaxID=37326 RepID=UPI0024539ADC|nr:hypothetical protein [Nocardia brasiliensis]